MKPVRDDAARLRALVDLAAAPIHSESVVDRELAWADELSTRLEAVDRWRGIVRDALAGGER